MSDDVIRPAPSFGKLDFRGGPSIRGHKNLKRRLRARKLRKDAASRGRVQRVACTPQATLIFKRAC